MDQAIRISPSGPIVKNPNGTPFVPGKGMQMRLVEASSTIAGGSAVIPTAPTQLSSTLGATSFTLKLDDPKLGAYYRAHVHCDVNSNSTNVTANVELYLDTSVDEGATWESQVSNGHQVMAATVGGTARQITLEMVGKLGSSLSVSSSPETASLWLRCRIGASAGGGTAVVVGGNTSGDTPHSVGNAYMSLVELF